MAGSPGWVWSSSNGAFSGAPWLEDQKFQQVALNDLATARASRLPVTTTERTSPVFKAGVLDRINSKPVRVLKKWANIGRLRVVGLSMIEP
tara:strand:- start:273 stop:545 length:273 start_codon:yes stop_codon:yes gene_type:complete